MNIPEYVEMEFSMPFYELYFPNTWDENGISKDPFELIELAQIMNITLDTDLLYKTYEEYKIKMGDIYLFYPDNNTNIFLYFDLLKDEYDQMAMINFGVRVKTEMKSTIKDVLMKLYFISTTRSAFKEDYFNQGLNKIATNNMQNQERAVIHFMNGMRMH